VGLTVIEFTPWGIIHGMVHGVDVSRFQGNIDWHKVKASGRHFAFVKATEGLTFVDPSFTAARVKSLREAKMLWAPYHFARPQAGRSGAQEAQFFVKTIKVAGYDATRDLPPVLDIESTKLNAQGTLAFINSFVTTVRALVGGDVILYTYPNFWNETLDNPANDFDCLLWIANYGVSHPAVPRAWSTWTFWQFSDKSSVPGIPVKVDENYFNGNEAQLLGLAKRNARPANDPLTETERKLVNELSRLRAAAKKSGWKPGPQARAEAIKKWIRYTRMPYLAQKIKTDGPTKYGRQQRYKILKEAYKTWGAPTDKWPADVPKWVPKGFWTYWREPWRPGAKASKQFRALLDAHGYLSPNFTLAEAKCKCGAPIPTSLNSRARDQAFNLEVLRHRLGDKPIPIISWYRPSWYNKQIGGALFSQHINAVATDHPKAWVDAVGRTKVMREGNIVFNNDGMGVYPWGAVHFDDRGVRARWNSWGTAVLSALGAVAPTPPALEEDTGEDDQDITTLGFSVDDLYTNED
jgi:GH25 family lysozyme M1 (1,4-beta-N-acetylmuramidase)